MSNVSARRRAFRNGTSPESDGCLQRVGGGLAEVSERCSAPLPLGRWALGHWVLDHWVLDHWVLGQWVLGVLVILSLASGTGCVKRRLTIRSNPPGARVLIDDQEIGVTPVSTAYTYYATRKIQLIKDGFEPLTVLSPFSAPWYEIPPLDLFSENFAGREIRDERAVEFQLVPQQLIPEEVLLGRAEQLRGQARQGFAVPLLPPAVGSPPPAVMPPAAGTPFGVPPAAAPPFNAPALDASPSLPR